MAYQERAACCSKWMTCLRGRGALVGGVRQPTRCALVGLRSRGFLAILVARAPTVERGPVNAPVVPVIHAHEGPLTVGHRIPSPDEPTLRGGPIAPYRRELADP
jgi:hypothetical protein